MRSQECSLARTWTQLRGGGGGGSPSYSKQAGGDGEAAGILSPHYQHTGKTESSSEINRSTVETIQ